MKRFENCFFVPSEAIGPESVTVSGAEAKHIAAVVRHRSGDIVTVVDGCGGRYRIELTECSPAGVIGQIKEKQVFSPRRPELWLAAGLIRAPRMEILIEKCTELGVQAIIPLCTKRSVSSKGVSELRLARWERIAVSAMTQSARVFLPKVNSPVSVEGLLQMIDEEMTILLAEPRGKPMQNLGEDALSARRLLACVGPEGGFSPDEMECLMRVGAIPVSLSEARLRAETAAISILDRLSFLLEGSIP